MTEAEIKRVQDDFRRAAERSLAAGCEWLEIHSAHGHLNHEFLSPVNNQRQDRYGGSFENSIRFLVETTRVLRAVWPDRLPLTVRLSCKDWVEGAWNIEQSVELSRRLKGEGVDLIDCSTGGNLPHAKTPVGPGYRVPFAARIRAEVGIATAAVGIITESAQANEIIRDGKADIVLLARQLLRDPYWPYHAALALGTPGSVKPPPQYARAW
jgi:2,4-dienoyl-CoA reductase-like NADH-dependent reductase (Old Yellow Enzyme family)